MPTSNKRDIVKYGKIWWENIIRPNDETVKYLNSKHNFHHLDMEDLLSKSQRPKIDEYEKYLFIVLHFPYYDKRSKSVKQDEVHIFIGQSYIITASPGNKVLDDIFTNLKKRPSLRKQYMGNSTGFLLYSIIDEMFAAGFPILDKIADQIDDIEREVFKSDDPKDMLKDILYLKKDIINFRRIIIPQRTVIAQLEHKNKRFLPEELEVYFDDTVDKIERLFNSLETLKEIVASLQETNESILSHNTNNIIKVLTIFSVIMLPLTFVTGVYGMNIVGLPVSQHPLSFFILLGVFASIAVIMLAFFKYKRWM